MEIALQDVGQAYGERWLFRHITAQFRPGTITAVTGPNGSGKSTLLRICARLAAPVEGKVTVTEGERPLIKADYRERLALVTPELRFYPCLTAWENMLFLLGLRGQELSPARYSELLSRVGLQEARLRGVLAGSLSTGQRQRLKLAVLLASEAQGWLLDEPGANLDASGRALVLREARKHAESGGLVLWATNDEREEAAANACIDLGRSEAGL